MRLGRRAKLFIIIVIAVLVSEIAVSSYLNQQMTIKYKACERQSDCKVMVGCDSGCWNVEYNGSGLNDVPMELTCQGEGGPYGCACYENFCVDAIEVIINQAGVDFEEAFSRCEEIYANDIENLFFACYRILCSTTLHEFERKIISNQSIKEVCMERVSDFCERGEGKYDEEYLELECGNFFILMSHLDEEGRIRIEDPMKEWEDIMPDWMIEE